MLLQKRFISGSMILLLAAGFIFAACVVQKSPVTGNKRAYGYSWEKELEIGQEVDKQIQSQYGVYDNEELSRYVEELGQKILQKSHMRREDTPSQYKNTEFTFRVLDSPIINAFALPGGYIYVTRGLLSHLDNEAQLAVVLGHEIAHVAARHSSQQAFQQKVGQLAVIGGAVAGEQFLGVPGGSILDLGSQAAQLLFLSYSRDAERESDALGVEYAAMQNYDASEGSEFFVTLQRTARQAGHNIPDWQSTHPDPAERSTRIPRLAEEWEQRGYEQTVSNTDLFMQKIDGIIFGNNPREGFTRSGNFYHPDLAFQFPYPKSWDIINQRYLVAAVNAEQDAVAIMRLDSESASHRVSVEEFLNQDGISTVSKSETNYNGLNGYQAVATGQSQNGQEISFYLYSVTYRDTIYQFITYTSENQFGTYKPLFEDITQGFKPLEDSEILNIEPLKLQTIKTNRTDTFNSFLPDNLEEMPVAVTPEDLAILNQVELDETIEAGSWIKIPQQ